MKFQFIICSYEKRTFSTNFYDNDELHLDWWEKSNHISCITYKTILTPSTKMILTFHVLNTGMSTQWRLCCIEPLSNTHFAVQTIWSETDRRNGGYAALNH